MYLTKAWSRRKIVGNDDYIWVNNRRKGHSSLLPPSLSLCVWVCVFTVYVYLEGGGRRDSKVEGMVVVARGSAPPREHWRQGRTRHGTIRPPQCNRLYGKDAAPTRVRKPQCDSLYVGGRGEGTLYGTAINKRHVPLPASRRLLVCLVVQCPYADFCLPLRDCMKNNFIQSSHKRNTRVKRW